MKKLINLLFVSLFFVKAAFTENAEVQSRTLPEEVVQQMEVQNIEEQATVQRHECDKAIQTGIFSNEFPPLFFPYSCHSITAVSAIGDSIALEDGSIWYVAPSYAYEVIIWKESDPLLIYPTRAWLSTYKYTIFNQALGTSVPVNMTYGPLIDGEFSLRIVAIDYIRGEVYLNDNSRWTICDSDRYLLEHWLEGDYIIIGSNNSWFCSLKNIIINSNMYNHIRAQQF